MKTIPIFLAMCLITAPVVAVEFEGNSIKMSDEEIQACRDGGGCFVVPKDKLIEAMQKVQEQALMGCGKRT